jgi:exodeoxyribonuclease V beta subunit
MAPHPPVTIHDIGQIDLDRHGLIEASAGTGKTYTIENLVVRLLMEKPDLSLENILLVTFTEKATCELKIRIREKIEQTLNEPHLSDMTVDRLALALDAFDTAPIHTIHGFCHSLLKDFAFENNILFQTELVDDRVLYEKALKEQMRSVWPQRYGRLLPQLLTISDFSNKKSNYLDILTRIAGGGFCPEAGDRMQPDPGEMDISSLIKTFTTSIAALNSLAGPDTGFCDGYKKLNFHAGSRKAIISKVLHPLKQWLSTVDPDPPDLAGFAQLIDTMNGYKKFKESGAVVLKPQKYNRNDDNSSTVCPHLDDVIRSFSATTRIFDSLKYIVAVESIVRLKKEVEHVKQAQGWISYDDMLKQVFTTLTRPGADRLLRPLREQYRYGFVDEFQDTDPIQWQIFARIFIESETNRLFLIGDPKQAIYSFRGADVFTYLSARHRMQQLADNGQARCYFLDMNWRSTPALVTHFNRLFSAPPFFGPPQETKWHEITYLPATSPAENDLPEKMIADTSGRNALNLIDLRGPRKPGQAAADLARFIAREIKFLITDRRIVLSKKNDPPRPLDPGDICILVRSRNNAILMEAELEDHQIPYSYYQKPGLFASDEAYYLSVAFNAILAPLDGPRIKKALLTPFFRFHPDDLYAYDDVPATHPARRLFLHWYELAQHRRWGEMFQSILTDTGLIFRDAGKPQWDRAQANYQQVFAYLSEIAYRKNLNFQRMCTQLDGYRHQIISAESDADIHEIETEKRKVQIMTMHRAKGLQFPVVFIAGGLTQGVVEQYHCFHHVDADHPGDFGKVIDLSRTVDPGRHLQESIDEDKRLLYVALTRAQFKLYLPFFPALNQHRYFGPVCRFMAQAIEVAFPVPAGSKEMESKETGKSKNVTWLKSDIHHHAPADPAPLSKVLSRGELPPDDLLPTDTYFVHRSTVLDSFSSIHGKMQKPVGAESTQPRTTFTNPPTMGREDDESTTRQQKAIARAHRPADDIPGGPDVGSMFHDILEHIDFAAVIRHPRSLLEDDGIGDLIHRQMAQYGVDSIFRSHVARVVEDTLTTPIPQLKNDFSLGMLTPEDRRHEISFYYTTDSSSDRFIRGVVDLVFRYEKKYYIADWKSNYLVDGYGVASMAASMDAADYRLQYRLYTVAVRRWLQQVLGDRFDPEHHFGGVFYFYLRGMGIGPDHGIYYVPPDEVGSMASLETEMKIQIKL